MPNCPRCGATNKGERETCWNCWTKLPSVTNSNDAPAAKTQVWVKPQSKVPAVRVSTPKNKTGFHFPARSSTPEPAGDIITCPNCSATNSTTRNLCWSCWAELRPIAKPEQSIIETVAPPIAIEKEVSLPVVPTLEEAIPEIFELPEEFLPAPATPVVVEPVPLPEVIIFQQEFTLPIDAITTEIVADEITPAAEIEIITQESATTAAADVVVEPVPLPEVIIFQQEFTLPIEDTAAKIVANEIEPVAEIEIFTQESATTAATDIGLPPETTATAWWYIALPVSIAILAMGAMLCWNFWLQPRMSTVQITRITQTYLSALEQGDINTQTHLATQSTKGIRLPGWITIGGATLLEPNSVQEGSANYGVTLRLIPSEDKAEQIAELRKALSHQYQLEIVLCNEDGKWLVDQQRLVHDLRAQLTAENPDLTFPKW